MNAHDPHLDPLDHRAARAATDLRARAAARPIPALDVELAALPPLPSLHRSRRQGASRMLAAAAAVLVLAAVAGILALRSTGAETVPAEAASGDPRPFVAGHLPTGYEVAGIGGIGSPGVPFWGAFDPIATGATTIYGAEASRPGLVVQVLPGPASDWIDPAQTDLIDLPGGRTVDPIDDLGLGKHALRVARGDRATQFITTTMEADELQAVASAVVDGDARLDLDAVDLPVGWHELGHFASDEDSSVDTFLAALEGGGNVAFYTDRPLPSPDSDDGHARLSDADGAIAVSSTAGGEQELYARAAVAAASSTTTVRGHDAIVATMPTHAGDEIPLRSISWIERPGELVRVTASGLDEPALVAVAEDVRPVSPMAWKALAEQSQTGAFDAVRTGEEAPIRVGQGRFPDDLTWRLTVTPADAGTDPEVHLAVSPPAGGGDPATTSGRGTAADPAARAILATETIDFGDLRLYSGALVAPEVARVEVRDADGTVIARPDIVEGHGHRGVATPVATASATLVALAADGTELDRAELRAPSDLPTAGADSGSGSASDGTTTTTR